ncbi:unnamed protein product [Mytilus coruscus]|uniref:Uncharacterized protein n=1 Tax=Mytilus coruscus TaxID=42192 RepID=A0A6J8A778_MYTCO|nr:unnamed protein product [Mytilus coruscus]
MGETVTSIDEIEFDPEAFTSIFLMQHTLKGCNAFPVLIKHIPELKYIVENPRVLVLKDREQTSLSELYGILTHNTDMVMRTFSTTIDTRRQWECPFAIVVFLRASGGHGSCRLSVSVQTENLANFCSCLEDECMYNRQHGLYVHELKTVAYRHEKVVGFGYIDGTISIYLNGSRVNKFKTAGKDSQGYGTVGMFLEDNNGSYFFTTCTHVIDKDANAYLPHDNSKIGENVFVCHSNAHSNIKNAHKMMDFSLIRVCSDKDVECNLGLKGVSGNFIKRATIFRGDISEILGRRVYKWGSTEPLLQTGKCIGIEEEEFVYVHIDKENFAKPGDSGAIICVGDNRDTTLAAFVLVGEWISREDEKNIYVVYAVIDALDTVEKMQIEMKPCLGTKTVTIVSGSR